MKKQLLEAGKIVNTHGVRGEVRIQPWTNTPEFFCSFETLYIDESPVALLSARPHKDMVIAALEGISGIDDAISMKNKVVFIDRADAVLPEGENFIQDIIGLDAIDAGTGEKLGIIKDVLSLPASNVYEIQGERTILVPAVDEFIIETDIAGGFVRVRLIEGM